MLLLSMLIEESEIVGSCMNYQSEKNSLTQMAGSLEICKSLMKVLHFEILMFGKVETDTGFLQMKSRIVMVGEY